MRKLLPFALLFLLSSCGLIPERPAVGPNSRNAPRVAAASERVIHFVTVVADDCSPATRHAHAKDEIVVMCATPEQYRKLYAPVEGAECHP